MSTIQIKAPDVIGDPWYDLEIDRSEFSVESDIKVYELSSEETEIKQLTGSKFVANLTGYISLNSTLPGINPFNKALYLIHAARYWYYNLGPGQPGFPKVKIHGKEHDMLFQKLIVIDKSDLNADLIEYNMSLICER